MHAQGATDPSCAVRVASVTLRKISRFVARFACPCVFRFTRLRLFVKQRSHASSVAALTTAFTHQIVPMCIMSSSFLSPWRLYCCRFHALLLFIIPADTEPNAERLLPDAPVAAPSAPVGEEFNSQTTERARALPRPRARALEEACEPAHLTRLMSGRTMSLLLVSLATSRVCASLVHLANSGAG